MCNFSFIDDRAQWHMAVACRGIADASRWGQCNSGVGSGERTATVVHQLDV